MLKRILVILEVKKTCIVTHAKNTEYETSCTTARDSQLLIPKARLDLSDYCQFVNILHCSMWEIKFGY